jgi:putative photosynthetic complex assembly protein 2
MGALAIAVPYVLFVWWFSTGTVLFLVGLSERRGVLLKCGAALLFASSLLGVAVSSQDTTAAGACCVFTCAILLWGAVEISLLAGWVTGPRPDFCPRGSAMADRLWYALQAIAYHELALIGTALLVFAVTAGAPNQLGWWTFAALLLLRQSAKVNLFLGVRMLNDELLPPQVGFLGSYFARKPMNMLFPFSVTLATAAAAGLLTAALDQSNSDFEALAFSLLSVLVALGALEHWFMMLPVPVVDLWRWSVRNRAKRTSSPPAVESKAASETKAATEKAVVDKAARPVLAIIAGGVATVEAREPVRNAALLARQRLEDQFRQAYLAPKASSEEAAVRPELASAVQQTISTGINRTADGRAP